MIARIMARLFLAPAGLRIAVNDPTACDCRGFLLREQPPPANDFDEDGDTGRGFAVAVMLTLAMLFVAVGFARVLQWL